MSASRSLLTGRPMINPELAEGVNRFQTALHARLQILSEFDKLMIVIGLSLATCMESGTTTAINVILPDMQGNVGATADQISWAITIYSTAFLCSLPLSPSLARRFGHRNHILLSIALYALGALGCFLSHALWALLFSRAVMGIGGGALLVRSLTTIYQLFQGKARVKYSLLFGTLVLVFKTLMPVIFGAVTDWITWNAAFLLIIPIALSSAVLIYIFLPDRIQFDAEPPRADLAGIGFLLAGAAAFQIIASRGEQDDWFGSLHLRIAFVIGLVALAGFIRRDSDLNNSNPLLNLRLIATQRAVAAGLGIAVVFGAMLGGGLYVLPQYLRTIQTYNATQTGGFFFVDGLASAAGYFIMMMLLQRVARFYLVLTALILFIVGNVAFVYLLTGDTPGAVIRMALILHGMSTGMLFPAASRLILPQIDLRFISFSSAIYLFFRQLGTSIGVSAVLALVDIRQTLHSSRLLDTANRLDPSVTRVTQLFGGLIHRDGLALNASSVGADQLFSGLVNSQARLLAFIDVFWALQMLGLACVVLLFIRTGTPNAAANAPATADEHAPAAVHA
jgi:MFS transporter, DHA2 family, multidrug resistance protein